MWRLLVVDDDASNCKMLREFLQDKAYCDVAFNGKEALQALIEAPQIGRKYDAILLDFSMPVLDGGQVLKSLREQEKLQGVPEGRGVPVIMISAHEEVVISCFKECCDDYLVKPYSLVVLIEKLNKLIR